MNKSSIQARSQLPTNVGLNEVGDQGRVEVERFVRKVFAAAHGAEVTHFMPVLMDLRNDAGHLLGVLGLRDAVDGGLFLERYLDRPVEACLSAVANEPVDRSDIVEVGNLAVGATGGGRWLITALTAFMHAMDRGWVVFTCGPQLKNAFSRMGIDLLDLGEATPDALSPDERARWGSYYDQQPCVMAGRVAHGYQVLSALFEKECALNALWRCAMLAGGRARWN
ncbi:MAG: thermostable hemolysin [Gammaproteobacteria bacterium]|nr:thermostable hemolysin [Gammaproteobacteria bacterium]MBU1655914.1 thermostable hemolysin [Gammaproteobacteria bacterium]MBU1961786.1 thermostable hemolysin [Gammaproteobacteria bacterium]